MRFEVELWGTLLSISVGPAYTVEEVPVEYAHDRLYLADSAHAGPQEDPVFPTLDWGDDEDGRRDTARPTVVGQAPLDLGHRQRGQPDPGNGDGPGIGFR